MGDKFKFSMGQLVLFKLMNANGVEFDMIGRINTREEAHSELSQTEKGPWYDMLGIDDKNYYGIDESKVKPMLKKLTNEEMLKEGVEISNADGTLKSYIELINGDKIYMTKWGEQKKNELNIYDKKTFWNLFQKGEWKLNGNEYQISMKEIVAKLAKGDIYVDEYLPDSLEIDLKGLVKGQKLQRKSDNARFAVWKILKDYVLLVASHTERYAERELEDYGETLATILTKSMLKKRYRLHTEGGMLKLKDIEYRLSMWDINLID